MEEGLLLDGVDVDGTGIAVYKGNEPAVSILTHTAEAPLALAKNTAVGTEPAAYIATLVGHMAIERSRRFGRCVTRDTIQVTLKTAVVEGFARVAG
jgi:Tfp pilus assembly protein PilV